MTHHAATRSVGAALCTLAVTFLTSWTVGAPTPAAAAAADDDPGRMVLVLDSSGSMKEPAAGGETKIQAAKTALRQVIDGLPEEQEVGLRVYGAKVFSSDDAGACTDSQLEVPVETGNRDQLLDALDPYRPYGETPIGYALQEAGKDLGSEGKRNIVLVSDGEPTCDPDPCEVARELSKQGVDLRIDVVGLDVDQEARSSLQCIAGAGNGLYYDAANAEELAERLDRVATRAAQPFTTIGTPVTGGDSEASAPTIQAGDWVDRSVGDGESLYYEVERTMENSTISVSSSFRAPGETVFNRVGLTTPGQADLCGASADVEQLATGNLVSAGTAAGPFDAFADVVPDSPCVTADTLIAEVNFSGEARGIPIEIRVTEQPEVTDLESLPEVSDDVSWQRPDEQAPDKVVSGVSFGDAPTVEPGTYAGSIVPGETLTYQVEVDWGQQLAAVVRYPRLTGKLADAASAGEDPLTKVDIYSPARVPASVPSAGNLYAKTFFGSDGEDIGTITPEVNFLRIGSSMISGSGASAAGLYTVTVFLEKTPGSSSFVVPFELDLGVSGEAQPGPTFAEEAVDPDELASPSPPAESEEPTQPTEPAEPSESGGEPSESGGESDPESAGDQDDASALGSDVVIGGLGVLALLGAALLFLRNRAAG